MSATFSVNVGQVVEAERKSTVFDVLANLPDNTQKLITPRDVRDAFFSSWANAAFKVTTPSNSGIEYIGLDSADPSDRDIKKKILLGKRSFGNLDILNNTLINNTDADIFIYNTKSDLATQSSTKISILAGTDSSYFDNAPYIQSIYQTASNAIDLNLINPATAGAINIIAQTGRVAVNDIIFPTVQQTIASASNGRILRYFGTFPNGSLRWDDTNITLSSIGVPGATTSIFGDPVLINGYPLEFIEDTYVPFTVGGVPQGFSFSEGSFNSQNWPLTEVLRKVLYPYLEPQLSLSLNSDFYVEVGKTASVSLGFSVTHYARNSSENISAGLITGTTYSNGGISLGGLPGSTLTGTTITSTYSSTTASVDFVLAVSNVVGGSASLYPFGFSYSATSSIHFTAPIVGAYVPPSTTFFSVNPTSAPTIAARKDGSEVIMSGITVSNYKVIEPVISSNSYFIAASGSGYLYFYYPGTASISKIKDPNGLLIHDIDSLTYSAFTYSRVDNPISITQLNNGGVISAIPYSVYRTKLVSNYSGGGSFEFIF